MLELARSCKNLDTHIHVSTYFNNCHLGLNYIEEKVYVDKNRDYE